VFSDNGFNFSAIENAISIEVGLVRRVISRKLLLTMNRTTRNKLRIYLIGFDGKGYIFPLLFHRSYPRQTDQSGQEGYSTCMTMILWISLKNCLRREKRSEIRSIGNRFPQNHLKNLRLLILVKNALAGDICLQNSQFDY
jgi:hypothetical protein